MDRQSDTFIHWVTYRGAPTRRRWKVGWQDVFGDIGLPENTFISNIAAEPPSFISFPVAIVPIVTPNSFVVVRFLFYEPRFRMMAASGSIITSDDRTVNLVGTSLESKAPLLGGNIISGWLVD